MSQPNTALQFDARQVAPDAGTGDPLPTGWYNAMIDESELKPTGDGQGTRLSLRFAVLDGQHKGRKVYTGLNLVHSSQKTVEIARAQLSAICHAVGVLVIQQSTQELHGKPLKIRVTYRNATPEVRDPQSGIVVTKAYEASNDIKAFRGINEVVDMAAATAPGAVQQPAAPTQWAAPAQPAQPQQYAPPPAQQYAPAPVQQPAQQYAPPPNAGYPAPAPAPAAYAPAPGQPPAGWQPPPVQPPAPAQPPAQTQQYAPPPAQYAAPPAGPGAAQPWEQTQQPGHVQPAPFTPPANMAPPPAQGAAVPPWAQ